MLKLSIEVEENALPPLYNSVFTMKVYSGGSLIHVSNGSRTDTVNALNECLKNGAVGQVEYLQTHTLPKYVKDYFGTSRVQMVREKTGFSFHGPMLSIWIKKKHAHAAREELRRVIRKKLGIDQDAMADDD